MTDGAQTQAPSAAGEERPVQATQAAPLTGPPPAAGNGEMAAGADGPEHTYTGPTRAVEGGADGDTKQ